MGAFHGSFTARALAFFLLKIKNWVFFGVLYLRVMMPFFPCPFGAFNKIIGAFLVLFRVRFRLPDASIGLKWGFILCLSTVRLLCLMLTKFI